MELKDRIRYIFFDADDTLWENERYFRAAEDKFAALLADYTSPEGVQQMLCPDGFRQDLLAVHAVQRADDRRVRRGHMLQIL